MKSLQRFSRQFAGLAAVLVFLLVSTGLPTLASSVDPQVSCLANGGTWDGMDSISGTCTYPAGNNVAMKYCGAGYKYAVSYIEGSQASQTCTPGESYYSVLYMGCGNRVEGPNPDPVVVHLCWGYNGFVRFPAYVCPLTCLIGFVLPYQAAGDLPSGALATLYVQLDDTDGSPYNGTYTACFENPEGETLTLYRYISGEWRAINTSSRNPVCASATGDGSFYLGYPPS